MIYRTRRTSHLEYEVWLHSFDGRMNQAESIRASNDLEAQNKLQARLVQRPLPKGVRAVELVLVDGDHSRIVAFPLLQLEGESYEAYLEFAGGEVGRRFGTGCFEWDPLQN
jgi:hypothetical protein